MVLILSAVAVLIEPVQAVAVGAKDIVSALAVNPLVNIASTVYAKNNPVKFSPIGEFKAQGEAQVYEVPDSLGAQISLSFSSLEANHQYIAVYHHNTECEIEIDSVDNVIQGAFIADESGNGKAEDKAKDRISGINSISLRSSKNFKEIIACARV